MKTISEHLGQIIVALAAIALLVCAVVVFKTDLAGFFNNIIGKETSIADEVLANMGDFGVSDMDGSLSGSGDGQVFYQAAPETLSFRSTAPISEFKEVKVNGTTIDPSNYVVSEGSTIVTLTVEYLGTLPEGTYTITIVSESGSLTVTFKVVHGDGSAIVNLLNHTAEGEGQATVAVDGTAIPYQKSVAVPMTLAADGKFTVSCENACAVITSVDNGNGSKTYTRLLANATATENTYEFVVADIGSEMEIFIAIKGDINLDGKVRTNEIVQINNAHLGNLDLTDLQMIIADINGDGTIDTSEVEQIKAFQVGGVNLNW